MSTSDSSLCLACSSSLPPRAGANAGQSAKPPSPMNSRAKSSAIPSPTNSGIRPTPSKAADSIYITPCCTLPICPRCIAANPRLTRYNPCLSCLGGVDVVKAHWRSNTKGSSSCINGQSGAQVNSGERNGDGAVRDVDVWVVGSDDDEDDPEDDGEGLPNDTESPAGDNKQNDLQDQGDVDTSQPDEESSEKATKQVPQGGVYYIQKRDTLHGISLRFGVSARSICLLNSLPPSTLTTTPHLLHTRHTLKLPPSEKLNLPPPPSLMTPEQAERMERERAGKRLQMVTKEVDWRVAKAYVGVAEVDRELGVGSKKDSEYESPSGDKEYSGVSSRVNWANGEGGGSAVEKYLDDDEWETAERKAGRGQCIPKFPYGGFGKGESS